MNKNLTQEELLKIYFEEYGEITPLEAYKEFGILRLSAIIFMLRKLGYDIKTNYETSKNRYGTTVVYANYVAKRKWKVYYQAEDGSFYDEFIIAYDKEEAMKKGIELKKSSKDTIYDCYFVSLEWK